MLRRAAPGELEGVAQNPIHSRPGEDAGLLHPLVVGALIQAAPDLRVLSLGVLTNHDEVDVFRSTIPKRRGHARHQAHRSDIHILLHLPTNGDEKPPEGYVVRDAGKSHGPKEDGVVLPEPGETVFGHEAARALEALTAPIELLPGKLDAEAATHRLEHTDALGHHLRVDPVAGNHRDAVLRHRIRLSS